MFGMAWKEIVPRCRYPRSCDINITLSGIDDTFGEHASNGETPLTLTRRPPRRLVPIAPISGSHARYRMADKAPARALEAAREFPADAADIADRSFACLPSRGCCRSVCAQRALLRRGFLESRAAGKIAACLVDHAPVAHLDAIRSIGWPPVRDRGPAAPGRSEG